MSENKTPMTPAEEDKNAGIVRLADGTAYSINDDIILILLFCIKLINKFIN